MIAKRIGLALVVLATVTIVAVKVAKRRDAWSTGSASAALVSRPTVVPTITW